MTSERARVIVLLRSDRPLVAVGRLEPVVAALERLGADVDLIEFEDGRVDLVLNRVLGCHGMLSSTLSFPPSAPELLARQVLLSIGY